MCGIPRPNATLAASGDEKLMQRLGWNLFTSFAKLKILLELALSLSYFDEPPYFPTSFSSNFLSLDNFTHSR